MSISMSISAPPSVVAPPLPAINYRARWRSEQPDASKSKGARALDHAATRGATGKLAVASATHNSLETSSKPRNWRLFRDIAAAKRQLTSMPPWLVSMIVHLVLIIVLSLIVPNSTKLSQILLTMRQGELEAKPELIEFDVVPMEVSQLSLSDPVFESEVKIEPINQPIAISAWTLTTSSSIALVFKKTL